jgi:hypothetical protein
MKETEMEFQHALVNARIDELNGAAEDVRANRVVRKPGSSEPGPLRMAVGLWLVDIGMTLVHGSRVPASQRN